MVKHKKPDVPDPSATASPLPAARNPPDGKLEIGIFVGIHGIKGRLKLKSLTEIPEDILSYGPLSYAGGAPVPEVTIHGSAKGSLLVSLAGLHDRNGAEKLKGKPVYVDRGALPQPDEGEFYASDLEGLTVLTAAGVEAGTVKAMLNFGAGEVLEIAGPDGRLRHYPFTLAVFPAIDIAAGTIRFVPPEEVISQDEEGGVH